MKQYLELVEKILNDGEKRGDRTGTGTIGIFGHQMRFDLTQGFPLVTAKNTWIEGFVRETLWMVRGQTNIGPLLEHNVHIWDEWANGDGDLGPVYGEQWRAWAQGSELPPIDQLQEVIDNLKKDPYSRRHIVSAWNPADLPHPKLSPEDNATAGKMALAPCHCLFQFYVTDLKTKERCTYYDELMNGDWEAEIKQWGGTQDMASEFLDFKKVPDKALHCQLYQRSCDVFLGLPFNIAGYSLLTHMVAKILNYDVGEFIWTGGDVHLYQNHLEQAALMLTRKPRSLPVLDITSNPDRIEDFVFEDFVFSGYNPHPPIKAPVSK